MKKLDYTMLDRIPNIERNLIKRIWIVSFSISIIYFVIGYFFPIVSNSVSIVILGKFWIESVLYIIPIILSITYTYLSIIEEEIQSTINDQYQIVQIGGTYVLTQCFEIALTSNQRESISEDTPKYRTSMLLALRAGMEDNVNMAFETGVYEESPFIRLVISVKGKNKSQLKKILRKEATRSEAILVSSLEGASLRQLHGKELQRALSQFIDISRRDKKETNLLVIQGPPRNNPSLDMSQIGNFLSTLLKQQYSVSLTAVFSKTTSKKEKRKLESKYKRIRHREKSKEDSLSDYAEKQKLLKHYEKVQTDSGWFDTTIYLLFEESHQKIESLRQAVKGMVLSIWGGADEIKIMDKKISTKTGLQLISRRHMKRMKLHVTDLAAFVNFPVRPLPVISSKLTPSFTVPSKEIVDNELIIGKMIFEDRPIASVGLKKEWIREHVAVLGATGTGKTTLVRRLIDQISTKTDVPWWIFDVKGSEYDDLTSNDTQGVVIRPGLDETFSLNLLDNENSDLHREAHTTFVILRELLKERSNTTELSPAMERMLREAILELAEKQEVEKSVESLVDIINKRGDKDQRASLTRDALLNRLEILCRNPLGSILSGGKNSIKIEELLDKRVVFDLRYVARAGGMDAARLLYNLVAKKIFDVAMKRGISEGLHHIVVLEEASNLVPESYTRSSAADVTTGESMVLLQRATGQGVIVVSTRPNISSNILANTATKISFRLPYDSSIGSRFLALDEKQEKYLRTIKRGRGLAVFPGTEAFEISTEPFSRERGIEKETIRETKAEEIRTYHYEPDSKTSQQSTSTYDRYGNIANHLIAFLAANQTATEEELISHIRSFEIESSDQDLRESLLEMVSLGTIDRESLSLVDGGFIFCLPGKGTESVKSAIIEYLIDNIERINDKIEKKVVKGRIDLVIGSKAIIIYPQHIKASEIENLLEEISKTNKEYRNSFSELFVIVRGSVAAAELRDLVYAKEMHNIQVTPAFPSSLDLVIKSILEPSSTKSTKFNEEERLSEQKQIFSRERESLNLTTQLKIWKDLVLKFIEISDGKMEWSHLLQFIETTAIQSHNKRSIPLDIEVGQKCLKELLADEELVAIRIGKEKLIEGIDQGLWVLNHEKVIYLKQKVIHQIQENLSHTSTKFELGQGLFDIYNKEQSYIILPSQQKLLDLKQEINETLETKEIICIVAAAEYIDEALYEFENIHIRTIEEGMKLVSQ